MTLEGGTTRIILTHREKRVSFYDKLGTVGGTMGLFMGMTFMSMFEIGFLVFNIIMRLRNILMTSVLNSMQKRTLKEGCGQRNLDQIEQNVHVSYCSQ